MARRTQGTTLWAVVPTVADPLKFELLKIGCTLNFKPGTDSKSKLDDTCLDQEDNKTHLLGLAELGQATFDINFDPTNLSHLRLKALEEGDTEVTWVVGFAGKTKGAVKTLVPTVTDAGVLTLPTGRSWIKFTGRIDSFPIDWEADSLVKTTVTIDRTSKLNFTPETT